MKRKAFICGAALVVAGQLQTTTLAGSYTWNNTQGNWSDASRWLGGVVPSGADPTDVLLFGGSGGSGYHATNDVASPFTLNQLWLDNGATIVNRVVGLPLRFAGANPRILEFGLRSFEVATPIVLTSSGLTMNNQNTLDLLGPISGAGALTKIGPGAVRLANNSTFMGAINVNAGSLRIRNDSGLGDGSNVVNLNGGLFALETTYSTTRSFAVATASSTIVALPDPIGDPMNSILRFFSGNFSGPGTLTFDGGAPVYLSGTNTQSGGTVIRGTIVHIANDAALGAPGAALRFVTGGMTSNRELQIRAPMTISRPIVSDGGGRVLATAAATLAGPILLNAGLAIIADAPVTISGGISGSGALGLGGSITLSGTNTYTTPLGIGGDLTLAATNTLSPHVHLVITSGHVFLNGFDQTVPNIESTGSNNGGIILDGGANLTFGGDNTNTSFPHSITGNGRLTKVGTGIVTIGGGIIGPGTIQISSGTIAMGIITSTNTVIDLAGGALRPVLNNSGGNPRTYVNPIVVNQSGTIDTGDRLYVWSGPITGGAGATLTRTGADAGLLRLEVASTLDGTIVNTAGTLRIRRTASFPNADVDMQGGTFGGAGALGGQLNLRPFTTLAPGDADAQPGILSIGQLTHATDTSLVLDINGKDNSFPPLAEYDVVNVSGAVALAGTLSAVVGGGFAPAWPDEFTVMTWSTRAGRFDAYAYTGLPAGYTLVPRYGAAALTLKYARQGDADFSGAVNLADFNALAANFGATDADWTQGDFTLDRVVNLLDFNLLAGNFGLSAGATIAPQDWAALAAAVPEPVALVGGAVLMTALRRRWPAQRLAGN